MVRALIVAVILCVLSVNSVSAESNMWALRECESGNDYAINTGNGYYGAYQFSLATWHWVGGEGYPHEASPEEQDYRAYYLLTRFGPHHWPVCQKEL